jgi:hypothetical protein
MKTTFLTLAALAFVGAAPALARPLPVAAAVQTDEEVDQALERLQKAARERGVTPEVYERWRNALIARARAGRTANPGMSDHAARLEAIAKELDERIGRNEATDQDFDRAREATLEERIDRAVAEIQRAVLAGRIAREDFDRALSLLRRKVEVAKRVNDQTPYRGEGIEALLVEIRDTSERTEELTRRQFAMLQETILRTRLEAALADLERQARARGASRAQYERWKAALTDWAATAAPAWPQANKTRDELLAKITAIEKAQAAGEPVTEMFAGLRTSLTSSVREASAVLQKK